jgi:hypothetical protein
MKPQTEKRNIKVTNPYSGQSAMLTQSEAIHYNMIKAFEKREEYELMQQGLDKFSRLNPEAYITLTRLTVLERGALTGAAYGGGDR